VNSVSIIIDSVASLPAEEISRYNIRTIPIKIVFEDRIYRDGIDLSVSEAYELLEKAPDTFTTAPSSPVDYANVYRELVNQGRSVLCLTISSRLSTAHNVALLAKDQVKKELPQAEIAVLDTRTATATEGLVALAAAQSAAQGNPLEEVIRKGRKVVENNHLLIALDTIRWVYRTGRIPKIATQVGTALGVKPLLTIEDGLAHLAGVVRTMHSGIERIIDNMKRRLNSRPIHAVVVHADVPDEGENLRDRIKAEFDCRELYLAGVSPIIGYAIGRGALGVGFYSLPEEA
jgi:DegV family protein with EDD domain